jgi:hypothetical protein
LGVCRIMASDSTTRPKVVRIQVTLTPAQERSLTSLKEARGWGSLADICGRAVEEYLIRYRPRRQPPSGSPRCGVLERQFNRYTVPAPDFLKRAIKAERQDLDRVLAVTRGPDKKFIHAGGGKWVGRKPKVRK